MINITGKTGKVKEGGEMYGKVSKPRSCGTAKTCRGAWFPGGNQPCGRFWVYRFLATAPPPPPLLLSCSSVLPVPSPTPSWRAAALGGSFSLSNTWGALGWLNPNAISILFYSLMAYSSGSTPMAIDIAATSTAPLAAVWPRGRHKYPSKYHE